MILIPNQIQTLFLLGNKKVKSQKKIAKFKREEKQNRMCQSQRRKRVRERKNQRKVVKSRRKESPRSQFYLILRKVKRKVKMMQRKKGRVRMEKRLARK